MAEKLPGQKSSTSPAEPTRSVQELKDELIRCEDTFEACFIAKDLAEALRVRGDEAKAIHYFFLSGENFIREGEIFQAMAVHCCLRSIEAAKKESQDLKTMISETFGVARKKRKESDRNVPIPTPFQEFNASVIVDIADEAAVPRHQLIEKADAKFALFSSLRPAELEALLDIAIRRPLQQDDVLYKEGGDSGSFFVLVTGEVMISNRQGYCRTMGPGEFVGDISYFAGLPRGATVVAQEPGEVLEFQGRKVSEIFKKLPNLQERIWYFYERRLFLNIATRQELFKGLSLEEIGVVYDYLLGAEASEKRTISKPDSLPDCFYFVVQGRCELTDPEKGRVLLSEGSFIQMEDFIKKRKVRSTVVTKASTYLLELNRDSFEKVCGLLPVLAKNAYELSLAKSATAFLSLSVID